MGAKRNQLEKGRAEQVRARNCLHGELLPYAVEDTRTVRTQRQRYISKTFKIHIRNALFISFFSMRCSKTMHFPDFSARGMQVLPLCILCNQLCHQPNQPCRNELLLAR